MNKFLVKLICFFIPIRKYRKKIKHKLMEQIVSGVASAVVKNARGNVLVCYMKDSLLLDDNSERLKYHTNRWENREIARIFLELGYNVDCIDFNHKFVPTKKYDIVFDTVGRFKEFAPCMNKGALKILYLAGSYGEYNNKQEEKRLQYFNERHKAKLPPERVFERNDEGLEEADVCLLVGNEHTRQTYPAKFLHKIQTIGVTGGQVAKIKTFEEYYPEEKEFLWIGGAGPVHKGLDLLLDIFTKHPEWHLNIMCKINSKSDFYKYFKKELTKYPNIHFHGLVMPSSELFEKVVSRCFATINPSCAEGMSTATLTALSVGLYPIISYDNGFTLPENCGIYLDECSIDEIENAISEVWNKNKQDICQEIKLVHNMVLNDYSREKYHINMYNFIASQIERKNAN